MIGSCASNSSLNHLVKPLNLWKPCQSWELCQSETLLCFVVINSVLFNLYFYFYNVFTTKRASKLVCHFSLLVPRALSCILAQFIESFPSLLNETRLNQTQLMKSQAGGWFSFQDTHHATRSKRTEKNEVEWPREVEIRSRTPVSSRGVCEAEVRSTLGF